MWLLLLIYVPGTIYGYFWYENQLRDTWMNHPLWQIPFVPDSPTASLFFCLAALWLWVAPKSPRHGSIAAVRGFVEALGVASSVKYGLWATAVIIAGWAQGDALEFSHWMLMVGHTAMAICALLYTRFFRFGLSALLAAALWLFLNDTIDYTFGVFPYLPEELNDNLLAVATFTFLLTAASVWATAAARYRRGVQGTDV